MRLGGQRFRRDDQLDHQLSQHHSQLQFPHPRDHTMKRVFKMRERGFSLVELMIAVTLGLLLIGAVTAIFLGSRQSYHTTNGTSTLTDSGRFATDFVNRALRSTGFIGCSASPVVSTTGL